MSGAGSIDHLKTWWGNIVALGPKLGYNAKPSKSWLIAKPQYLDCAKKIFQNSGLHITTQGRKHLGAALGSEEFK